MSAAELLEPRLLHHEPSRPVPLGELKPYPDNARLHGKDQIAKLKAALREFGLVEPLVVQRSTMFVLGGNGRLRAMDELGWKAADAKVIDLDDQKARLLNVALNRLGELSTWDEDILPRSLAVLADVEDIDPSAIGYDTDELDAIVGDLGDIEVSAHTRAAPEPKAEVREIATPEPPKVPVTKIGDLWEIGTARLLCGDCRESKDVARLLGGAKASLLVTDPPYCSGGFQEAGRAAGTFGDIASDQLSSRGYATLMQSMLVASRPRAAYLFTDWRMWIPLFDTVEASGLPVRSMIVWDKGTPGLGSLWRTQHELVMFASRDGKKREKGEAAYGNVINSGRSGNVHHYTEKPIAVMARLLEGDAASPRGKAAPVYDAFAGSGSTLLAAVQLGRPTFGMEVEPKWVDVMIQRLEELTGSKAKRAKA